MKIIIDADACPHKIKEVIFNASIKREIHCLIVANQYINHSKSPYIRFMVVDKGFDVADTHIVKIVEKDDVVITSDVLLAKDVIEKNAYVITFGGKEYTKSNIGTVLSMRNFYTDMRDAGLIETTTKPMSTNNINSFAKLLDRYLTKIIKANSQLRLIL
jgi:uncharacterized protein YaiI (UPF0178 family)